MNTETTKIKLRVGEVVRWLRRLDLWTVLRAVSPPDPWGIGEES